MGVSLVWDIESDEFRNKKLSVNYHRIWTNYFAIKIFIRYKNMHLRIKYFYIEGKCDYGND